MSYSLETLRGDVFGGLTAAVVALPLSLAFGVASGLGAVAGLYGAIAVGFFAAVFEGTATQVSGPSAPLSVAIAVVVTSQAESLSEAFTIVFVAGLIQVLLGVLKVSRFVAYTPHSVISGFMSGVGAIIVLVQTVPLLGSPVALGGPLESIQAWPDAIADLDLGALALGLTTLVVAIAWPRPLRRILPPVLAALVVGTLLGVLWLSDAPVIGDVPTGLPDLYAPDLSFAVLADAIQPAVTVALLGSINSLLTALVVDSMTRQQHNPNRELIGQGIGNMAAGILGGAPGAGATSRTVANIQAGARTRVSGALCAVVLLALVLGLGRYVESIPHAVLAGILMRVGWGIVDWRFLARIRRVQREHAVVMLITFAMTVLFDLVTAVAVGLIAAAMAGARQFERLEMDSVVSVPLLDQSFLPEQESPDGRDDFSARVGLVALRGSFTVASSRKLVAAISADISEHEVVMLDFSETVYMDDSAAMVVEQLIDNARQQDTECIVIGLSGSTATVLQALDVLHRVPADRFVDNLDEARNLADRLLATDT